MRFGAILDHLGATFIHFGPFGSHFYPFGAILKKLKIFDFDVILVDFWPIFGRFLLSLFGGFPLWPPWETQNLNVGAKKIILEPFFCISGRYSYFEGFFFFEKNNFFFDFFFFAKSFLGFSPLAPMARRRLLSGR